MSQENTEYEKKIAKANAARQRQLEKQKAKLASPEYQKAQQEKYQASQLKMQQRALEKKKAQLDDPEYQEAQQLKQRETQMKAFEKQRARQQEKEASPENKAKKIKENKILQEILQERKPSSVRCSWIITEVEDNIPQ